MKKHNLQPEQNLLIAMLRTAVRDALAVSRESGAYAKKLIRADALEWFRARSRSPGGSDGCATT